MNNPRSLISAVLSLSIGFVVACDDGDAQPDDDTSGDVDERSGYEIVAPEDAPGAHDGAFWAASWWRWAMGQPATGHPLLANDDVCAGQDGPVVFLGSFAALSDGTGPVGVVHSCTIDDGTLVLVPVVNTTADNAAMAGATWQDDDTLLARATGFVDGMDVVVLDIDGDKLVGDALDDLRVGPYEADYAVSETDDVPAFFGHPAAQGTVSPSFGDGIYALVRLSPGAHTITASALDVRDAADPDDDFRAAAVFEIVVQ